VNLESLEEDQEDDECLDSFILNRSSYTLQRIVHERDLCDWEDNENSGKKGRKERRIRKFELYVRTAKAGRRRNRMYDFVREKYANEGWGKTPKSSEEGRKKGKSLKPKRKRGERAGER